MNPPRSTACSYPACPNASFKSPWERDELVGVMLPKAPPHHCTRLHVPRLPTDFQYSTRPATHKDPSSHHALALLTAPRPSDTLCETLASLRAAGVDDWQGNKILTSDGPLCVDTPLLPNWIVSSTTEKIGSARSFVRSLRLALSLDPDLDHLTFVEDDVEMSKNTLSYVARLQVPGDVAFVTWFTYDYDYSSPAHPPPYTHPAKLNYPVLACRSSRYFILTQCCTFPRRTVDRILACPMASENWPKRDAHDELISWALGDSPLRRPLPHPGPAHGRTQLRGVTRPCKYNTSRSTPS